MLKTEEADYSFLSKSGRTYRLKLAELRKAEREFSNKNGGLPPTRCLLLCFIAERPGVTFDRLALLSDLPYDVVHGACMVMASGEGALVRFEKEDGPVPDRIFLSEAGKLVHKEILQNG